MKNNLTIFGSYIAAIVLGLIVYSLVPKNLGIPPAIFGVGSGVLVYVTIKSTNLDKSKEK